MTEHVPDLPIDESAGTPAGGGVEGEVVLFDQYSRYKSCAQVLRTLIPAGGTVLDVGSGPLRVLGVLLPDHNVAYVDPLLEDGRDAQVFPARLEDAPLAKTYDAVVSVDTLEHVPLPDRQAFIARLSRLARECLILSGPWSEGGHAARVDDWVEDSYRKKTGRSYPWLAEHVEFGLPSLEKTRASLEHLAWHCQDFGNGHVPWLERLLPLVIGLLDRPEHRPVLEALSRHFNERMYRFDHLEPVYRRLLVARRVSSPWVLERLPDDERTRKLAAEAWREMEQAMAVELSLHSDRLAEAIEKEAAHDPSFEFRRLSEELRQELDQERGRALEIERRLQGALDEEGARSHELEQQRSEVEAELRLSRSHADALASELESMRSRLSWRMGKPLRGLGRLSRGPLKSSVRGFERVANGVYHRLPIGEHQRWMAKEAFFGLFGRWMKSAPSYQTFQIEKRWRTGGGSVGRSEHPDPPPEAAPGVADVFVWGVIDWHFRFQRPQQIARELARCGHRVFYISPSIIDESQPGFEAERLDEGLALYSLRLCAQPAPVIYAGPPSGAVAEGLRQSLREVLAWAEPAESIGILDHPAWHPIASIVPSQKLMYDWMDHHAGFAESGEGLEDCERELVSRVDVVVTTSRALEAQARSLGAEPHLIRNGCEYEHFAEAPTNRFKDKHGRRVIGYYGAIAEWFDSDLVRKVASAFPDCLILLVGADSAGVLPTMEDLSNVQAAGEVSYADLPSWLHGMDVCLIPFLINDLTRATNPVKVYEYLAAARPVVTTDLPELAEPQVALFVRRGRSEAEFIGHVRAALAEDPTDPVRDERRQFARSQSWTARARFFETAVASVVDPLVSVVVVTWNNAELSRRCVESVLEDSGWGNLEVIVVDNASSDSTPDWLGNLQEERPEIRMQRNRENLGFAAACNQGLELARGEYRVILNNDTVVTPGWVRTLVGHLRRDPSLGLIGPVTNNIGNEARVQTAYSSMSDMRVEARRRAALHAGRVFEIPVLAFFCVMIPGKIYREIGGLDEAFGMGFFEDDDYCQRVLQLGLRLVCAEDVFVHHELSAGFDMIDQGQRKALFEANRSHYESKWGVWRPHQYRPESSINSTHTSGCEQSPTPSCRDARWPAPAGESK